MKRLQFKMKSNGFVQKHPEECEKAREDTLKIILKTLESWSA